MKNVAFEYFIFYLHTYVFTDHPPSLCQVEVAVQKSGPLHRLDAQLSEINTGLDGVQGRLNKKCPNVAEAESVQKVRLTHWDCGEISDTHTYTLTLHNSS